MAWAEAHILTGIGIYFASNGNLGAAVPLSVLSHWPLDDLNVGQVAKVYHGIGRSWKAIITSVLRVPLWLAIGWIFWHHPLSMACGLPAWLVLDHEWICNLFGRHGYGLHERMWPKWLHSQWGLVAWFIVFGLLIWLLWR